MKFGSQKILRRCCRRWWTAGRLSGSLVLPGRAITPMAPLGNRRAFTLLELLVVISIISLLGAISTPVVNSVITKAREVKCKAQIKTLSSAIDGYIMEYGVIPMRTISGNAYTGVGDTLATSSRDVGIVPGASPYWGVSTEFVRLLMGLPNVVKSSHDYAGNTREIPFLRPKYAKNNKGGLVTPPSDDFSYLDPWGRGFRIHFDADANGQSFVAKTHTWFLPLDEDIDVRKKYIIMSLGADVDDASDNIYSWKN